jgi:hypothetical protein
MSKGIMPRYPNPDYSPEQSKPDFIVLVSPLKIWRWIKNKLKKGERK